MADAVIGALRVELSANTATLEDGLKQGESALKDFARNVTTIAAGIGLEKIIEKSVRAFVGFIKDGTIEAINHLDELNKTSQKIGLPVEQLAEFQHAASLADVETQTFNKSMVILSKNVEATARDAITPAANAFAGMGVQVKNTDGTLKTNSEILLDVADKFKGYEDGANKTALAVALFGRAGAELVPFLNQGRDGLQAAGEEARKFGLVVSAEAAQAAEQFNDNMRRLSAIMQGVFIKAVSEASGELVILSNALVDSASSADIAERAAKFVSGVLKGLAAEAAHVSANVERLSLAWTFLQGVLKAQFGDIETIQRLYKEWSDGVAATIARLNEQLNIINGIIPVNLALAESLRTLVKLQNAIIDQFSKTVAPGLAAKDTVDKFEQAIARFTERTRDLRGETTGLAQGFLAQAVQLGIMSEKTAQQTTNASNLTEQQKRLNATMLEFQGAELAAKARTPWEQLEVQIRKTSEAIESGKLTEEERFALQRKNLIDSAKLWTDTAESAVGPWANLFATLAKENKKFAVAAKATAIAMAIINTAEGVTKTIATLGFPLAAFVIPAVIAAGALQIAAITAQQFAKGGSFRIGGGMTGVDSEMVAFRATPGEMVDVRRPGQERGGVQTINLNLPSTRDFFSMHVREMVRVLNNAAPDGYVLKVAT